MATIDGRAGAGDRVLTRGVQLGRWQLGVSVSRRGCFLVVAVIVGLNRREARGL